MMEADPTIVREALNQWNFVIAAYVVGVGGTVVMIAWSWLSMKRAETKRDLVKRRSKNEGPSA